MTPINHLKHFLLTCTNKTIAGIKYLQKFLIPTQSKPLTYKPSLLDAHKAAQQTQSKLEIVKYIIEDLYTEKILTDESALRNLEDHYKRTEFALSRFTDLILELDDKGNLNESK
jgi:hypothetical protein